MTRESSETHLNIRDVETNVYVWLIIGNVLFGLLHPEHIAIAAAGTIFFTISGFVNLRSGM